MKSINTFEPTIKYYDLQMTLNNLDNANKYLLPTGYYFEFWDSSNDLNDWMDIHISTGEFASKRDAKAIFDSFYSNIESQLDKYLVFICNSDGQKIATATLSPSSELDNAAIIDWLAIAKSEQGKKLSKPLLSKMVEMAKDFGLNAIVLHTQTNSWLAAKIYLDFGFEPLNTSETEGWNILKTIINHPKLVEFEIIPQNEIFAPLMLNIKNQLEKLHNSFDFNVWYINERNDVYVHCNGEFFEYYFFEGGNLLVKKD